MKNEKQSKSLAWPTVQRLSEYLIILEQLLEGGKEIISSSELAEIYSNTPSQVRQDIFRLPGAGRVGRGYNAKELASTIRKTLGLNNTANIIIVGCGRMGMALARHLPFKEHGMELTGLFDKEPSIIGKNVEGITVKDISELKDCPQANSWKIAALCVPASAAQDVTDMLVEAGVKGILNFTRKRLKVSKGIWVQHEQIICSLMQLNYKCSEDDSCL